MFLPHGLGHMMGLDVHDMENFDQINVGFDEETRPKLEQFGTNCLRMGRRLEEGFVVTDEPGIYFIPALIDEWKASGHCKEFLNFDKLETYKDFGGIRIEIFSSAPSWIKFTTALPFAVREPSGIL